MSDSEGTVKKARIKEWRLKKSTEGSKRAKERKESKDL